MWTQELKELEGAAKNHGCTRTAVVDRGVEGGPRGDRFMIKNRFDAE